ncbi:MAG: YbhB/YbcL family Raf kinase inhibitor-like protein [Alphaproteobacteria bacterium]|nr:YbhB/YbcL family Raf kinase inhibitor-like protein [Alphaproteobacteria bacterium]
MKTLALGLTAVLFTASLAWSAPWMTSTSIKDAARIPVRFGGDDQKRACSPRNPAICPCPGKNVLPQLAWHDAPAGTKSFAILMYDIDGQFGAGVSHWVAYNIAATTTELNEGDGTGFTGGAGNRSNPNYIGLCPPQGDGPHHYLITVMATDLGPSLAPALTRDQFLAAAKGHLLSSATIGGLFSRQYN